MTVTVSTIYRYPVKSMGGDACNEPATTNGIPGDRSGHSKTKSAAALKAVSGSRTS